MIYNITGNSISIEKVIALSKLEDKLKELRKELSKISKEVEKLKTRKRTDISTDSFSDGFHPLKEDRPGRSRKQRLGD